LMKAYIPLPAGSMAVYKASGLAYYSHADWLGSTRLATTPGRALYYDLAYAPYGENYDGLAGVGGSTVLSFTGQRQDTVPGLYDFLYREYNPNHGRWPAPDPAGIKAASLENPQTWNRYAYVGNAPLISTDSYGLFNDVEGCYVGCGGGGISGDPFAGITDASIGSLSLDFGADWLNYQTGIFKQQAGLTSPIQQAEAQYQSMLDCTRNPGSCPTSGPAKQSDITITVFCGGALNDVTCQPPSQAVSGSQGFRVNAAFPGLTPGDVPVGSNIWQPFSALWRNSSGAANTALVATGAVVAGAPLAGELGASPVGDFLFARGTGLLNSNDYIRIGWAWARTSMLDYQYGGLTYFGVRILGWHLNNAIWSYPTHP